MTVDSPVRNRNVRDAWIGHTHAALDDVGNSACRHVENNDLCRTVRPACARGLVRTCIVAAIARVVVDRSGACKLGMQMG